MATETIRKTGTLMLFCIEEETVRFYQKNCQGQFDLMSFTENEAAETVQKVRFLADTMQEVNIVYTQDDDLQCTLSNVTPVETDRTIGELVIRKPGLAEQLAHRRRFSAHVNQPEKSIRGTIDTWEDGSASMSVQQTDAWGQVQGTKAYYMSNFDKQRNQLAEKTQAAADAITQFEEIAQLNQLEGCSSHLAEVQMVGQLLALTPR